MISNRHEVFLILAEQLNFSRAAELLNMSQPAVSKHVKALEQHYKTNLITRKGGKIQLSDGGKLLYNYLQEAKKAQNSLEFELSVLKDKFSAKGQLKLGASTTVALYILPKILSSFHKQYPEVKITLLNRNSQTIVTALIEEEIDAGIVEAKNKVPSIQYQPFLSDEVIGVCAAKSWIAKKGVIKMKEITQLPIVLREQGSGTLAALQKLLSKQKVRLTDLNVKVRLGGTEALKNFLKEDECLGFLPKRSVLKELRDRELVQIKIEDFQLHREFYFIQRLGNENDGLSKSFINFAKAHYNF